MLRRGVFRSWHVRPGNLESVLPGQVVVAGEERQLLPCLEDEALLGLVVPGVGGEAVMLRRVADLAGGGQDLLQGLPDLLVDGAWVGHAVFSCL